MSTQYSLDDRRPRLLSQLVGNRPVVGRLTQQLKNGRPPRRVLFHGPSGAGKTTAARILSRYAYCLDPVGIGDPCGRCARCLRELDNYLPYNE